MNKYELVILVDPKLPKKEMEDCIAQVEKYLGKSLLEKDDIGMLDLVTYIKGNERAYFVSYYVEMEPNQVQQLKENLKLMKQLIRFRVFKMGPKDDFLKFAEVNKIFELTEEEKEKQENEQAFHEMDTISKRKRKK